MMAGEAPQERKREASGERRAALSKKLRDATIRHSTRDEKVGKNRIEEILVSNSSLVSGQPSVNPQTYKHSQSSKEDTAF